jgi:DNA helicase II / ATP-dependent DNA helicase PcrA
MDALEAARRKAESLYEAAEVGEINGVCSPLGRVLAEAARHDVEVCAVPEGDSQLKGGKATFDSQALTILYEDVGTEFEKAFLIAHEIGHLVLEGRDDDIIFGVNLSQSIQEPSSAIERVIDYGGKERREVTMDLFAREFLVPRSLVKHLHVEKGLSSYEISDQLKAPRGVVLQQLLDALLLPVLDSSVPISSNKHTSLDDSQYKAASHSGSPFLLQAGPGTGKTKTLVQRIDLLLNNGVDPASILVLTFSNKAADELRERIALKHPGAIATLWIGTFHSFGLDLVHRFSERLGFDGAPEVVGLFEIIGMLEDELAALDLKHFRNLYDPTLDLKDMLAAISRAKDEVVDSSQYRKFCDQMASNATDDEEKRAQSEKCMDVAKLYEVYERLLKEKNLIDFGDLVSMPVILVERDKEVRNALRSRHKHILVDEYQDVNRASVRLLKAIAGNGENLWVVGDSRQSIYRFRGASSINMKRFSLDFPGAKTAQLDINYRSFNEIVSLYSTFSLNMKASAGALPLRMKAARGISSYVPQLKVTGSQDDEIAVLAQSVAEHKTAGFDYRSQAILCVSNKRLSEIASGLESLGIPVLYLGSLFEREEIRDLLSLLSLFVDRNALGLVRASTFPKTPIPVEDVLNICKHLKGLNIEPLSWVASIVNFPGLSTLGRVGLTELARILEGFAKHDDPWTVISTLIVDRLKLGKRVALSDDSKIRMNGIALWQLANFCRGRIEGKGLPIERLLSKIRRVILLSDDRDTRQLPQAAMGVDGVRLLTVHASKGLEFDVVHVPGMVASGLPGANRAPRCLPPDGVIEGADGRSTIDVYKDGHEEEEECKFFVAASRAKDRLILYASSKQPGGRSRSLSRYIDIIDSYLLRSSVVPQVAFASKAFGSVPIQIEGTLSLTDAQLNSYDRCPRRFLYTQLMAVGGRRSETAFLKMHNVVYEVISWFRDSHSESNPSKAELDACYETAWLALGPIDHGYSEDYKKIGYRLVEFLAESRSDKQLIKPEALYLSLSSGKVVVHPDEVSIDVDGNHLVRRVKTGKLSSSDTRFDDIEYTLLAEAAIQYFGVTVKVEAVHLASETQEVVVLTERKRMARLEKSESFMKAILRGEFPPDPNDRTCPTCPHFFICGDIPAGTIVVKK